MSHNASITLFMCDNCYWVTSQKSWQVGTFLVLCNMFLFIDTYQLLCNIRSTTGCETQAINMVSYKFLWNHLLLPTQVWISIHTKNQWTSKNAGLDDDSHPGWRIHLWPPPTLLMQYDTMNQICFRRQVCSCMYYYDLKKGLTVGDQD